MASDLLGRTNLAFPKVWLSLCVPPKPDLIGELADAAIAAKTVINISSQPGLFGGHLRGTQSLLMSIGGNSIAESLDEKHSSDLLQAHLIETLCGVGREYLDFYFLAINSPLEEYQINGALQALEAARQEGHVRFLGLYAGGSGMAALRTWQFHDAFDVVLLPRNHVQHETYEMLGPLAQERRVGVVTASPLDWGNGLPFYRLMDQADAISGPAIADLSQDHPVLVQVRTAAEIQAAVNALVDENFCTDLEPYLDANASDKVWINFLGSPDADRKLAAQKWQRNRLAFSK